MYILYLRNDLHTYLTCKLQNSRECPLLKYIEFSKNNYTNPLINIPKESLPPSCKPISRNIT